MKATSKELPANFACSRSVFYQYFVRREVSANELDSDVLDMNFAES